MSFPLVDCQGLVGAWTLGAVQAGFSLTHRASLGGFGDHIVDANRHLLGNGWRQDPGNGSGEWEPVEAALVAGTPPCSGFSLLNRSKKENARGPDSAINSCMRELVQYAGRCTGTDGRPGAEIVSFESVQGAGKQGRELMLSFRDILDDATGQRYSLSHVFTSGATVGAAQMRHRYYFVAHRIPFGIDEPGRRRVATYRDAIGDLVGLEQTWDEQGVVYRSQDVWWLEEQRILDEIQSLVGLEDHYIVRDHISSDSGWKAGIYLRELIPFWDPGATLEQAMRGYRERHGRFPDRTETWWDHESDSLRVWRGPSRIAPDRSGYVLTGGCAGDFVHYSEPRFLTVRELARLMGFPDSWGFSIVGTAQRVGMYIGKCCPVNTGRWIAEWFVRALEGNPGGPLQQIGEREFVHNSTLLYKPWLKEQQAGRS